MPPAMARAAREAVAYGLARASELQADVRDDVAQAGDSAAELLRLQRKNVAAESAIRQLVDRRDAKAKALAAVRGDVTDAAARATTLGDDLRALLSELAKLDA